MTHSDLLMIVPSRGRPHAIAELAQAWIDTQAEAKLLVCVDNDDVAMPAYVDACVEHGVEILVGPRRRMGPTLNEVAVRYADSWDAIGFCGDDHRPEGSWDAPMLAELDRLGVGIVYGDDGIQGPNLPTAVVMSAAIVRTLGWMAPPGLIHLFLDSAWLEMGQAADCLSYMPGVKIRHLHPIAELAEWDEGYLEANSKQVWDHDEELFNHWKQEGGLAAAAEKIRSLRG